MTDDYRAPGGISTCLLVLVCVLAAATPGRAEIGLVVEEPVGALGFFTRVGHAGTYLSNICPDGSPVRMRLCGPGGRGGVVSKYSPFSEQEDYDWAIVPVEQYLHGFESPDLAPLIGTPGVQRAIEQYNFGPLFSSSVRTSAGEPRLPHGQWRDALATRFDRNIYIFSVDTTPADDAVIIAAFNAAPNRSRFNFFYRNCTDQARDIFNLIWLAPIGNRTSGVTLETPKGLAKALVDREQQHPQLHLRVRRFAQIPGTFPRSRDLLFPLENMYKSVAFAPWWVFGGFREVALVAMFYHQVITPFSVLQSSKDFITPRAAQLTIEQGKLRRRQDEIRLALAAAHGHDTKWSTLSALNGWVFQRLADIRREKQAEADQVEGSQQFWQEIDQEFESLVGAVNWRDFAPEALATVLTTPARHVGASSRLIQHFDADGEFFVEDAGGGPWMRIKLADGQAYSTGLSMSQVGRGDSRVAALILVAVLDYTLHAPEGRRDDAETAGRLLSAFRYVTQTLPRVDAHLRAEFALALCLTGPSRWRCVSPMECGSMAAKRRSALRRVDPL